MSGKLDFYGWTLCPFAQRAYIGLVHKRIDYEYHHVVPYNKSKEWLAINPRGLVPAFIHNGKSIYESGICLEYLEDEFPETIKIFPADSFDRAQQRMWGDHICKKIQSNFFALLLKQDPKDQMEVETKLLDAIKTLFGEAHPEGPFLAGKELQFADIMLAPFALSFKCVLGRFRKFEVPTEWTRFHKWLEAVSSHPSVLSTMPDQDELIQSWADYSDNTAKSEAADAVRKGTVIP